MALITTFSGQFVMIYELLFRARKTTFPLAMASKAL
jgi:hypothetical protein